MADYSSLKVPELKKLLAEKKLSQTGNKADLVARLQEEDNKSANSAPAADKPAENKEDEISYSDDDAPAAPVAESATEPPAPDAAAATETLDQPAEAAAQPAEEKPAPPSFAIGLTSTDAEYEAKKRADRAKRFGIEEDEVAKKKAERAKRFGVDEKELASGLDSALPERSSLKRGRARGGEAADGNRPGKRQSLDRRGGDRRNGRQGREAVPANSGGQSSRRGVLDDPAEKAKAEKRAARFAAA